MTKSEEKKYLLARILSDIDSYDHGIAKQGLTINIQIIKKNAHQSHGRKETFRSYKKAIKFLDALDGEHGN